MHNPDFKVVLESSFGADEVRQMVDFVEQGFSKNGELVVLSVFLYAHEANKSFDLILAACQQEWDRNWHYQHSDIKGDPDAPGAAGVQNRASLENIYDALRIPSPIREGMEIRPQPLVVKTRNSTYHLSAADVKGVRSIRKEGDELTFTHCRLLFLVQGKRMVIEPLDDSDGSDRFETSSVASFCVGS
jgi:hypothetical protein